MRFCRTRALARASRGSGSRGLQQSRGRCASLFAGSVAVGHPLTRVSATERPSAASQEPPAGFEVGAWSLRARGAGTADAGRLRPRALGVECWGAGCPGPPSGCAWPRTAPAPVPRVHTPRAEQPPDSASAALAAVHGAQTHVLAAGASLVSNTEGNWVIFTRRCSEKPTESARLKADSGRARGVHLPHPESPLRGGGRAPRPSPLPGRCPAGGLRAAPGQPGPSAASLDTRRPVPAADLSSRPGCVAWR